MQEFSARRGFTFIELLIVMALIAILVGVVIYGTGSIQKAARDTQRLEFMRGIALALEEYKGHNWHYPAAGDPIPGGAVVSASNDFNSMMAVLGQARFLDSKGIHDPLYGELFGDFNGVDAYNPGAKFSAANATCVDNPVLSFVDSSGKVAYSYYSNDGASYILCLKTEAGSVKTFVSPPL